MINGQVYTIPEFCRQLEQESLEIVPDSLKWIPHPAESWRMIVALQVQSAGSQEVDDSLSDADVESSVAWTIQS